MSTMSNSLCGDALLLALAACSALVLPLALAWYWSAPRHQLQQKKPRSP
jgi:hypothetical protein